MTGKRSITLTAQFLINCKSDFSTVGGQNNRANQPANTGFDFNDFNTGSSEQPKAQTADVFFGNSNTQAKTNAGGMQDLMDIFS